MQFCLPDQKNRYPSPSLDELHALFLTRLPLAGIGYRSVIWAYSSRQAILSGEGSLRYGGRWNPPKTCRSVYASESLKTATQELLYGQRTKGISEIHLLPRVFLSFEFECSYGIDLSTEAVLKPIGLSRESLCSYDWLKVQTTGKLALTQVIGKTAWEQGIEILKVPSAADPSGINWVLFPENFKKGSRLLLHLPNDWPNQIEPLV